MQQLRKLRYDTPALNEIQAAVDEAIRPMVANPMLDGRLMEGLAVSLTATEFEHKLGRAWKGYVVTKADTVVSVWSEESSDETKFIKLDAWPGSATVDLWVF